MGARYCVLCRATSAETPVLFCSVLVSTVVEQGVQVVEAAQQTARHDLRSKGFTGFTGLTGRLSAEQGIHGVHEEEICGARDSHDSQRGNLVLRRKGLTGFIGRSRHQRDSQDS
jgi:hypothetical protein